MRLSFVVILIGIMAASAVLAQDSDAALALCDRLAAGPFDSTRPAGIAGVLPQEIDTKAAVPACLGCLLIRL